jgi:hypothetical protein
VRLLGIATIGLIAAIGLAGFASGKPVTETAPNLTAGLAHTFAERTVGKLGSYGYETEHHSLGEGIEETVSFDVSVSKISGRCIEALKRTWACPFHIDQYETIDTHRDSWIWEGEVHPEQNYREVKCQVLKSSVRLILVPLSYQKIYRDVPWKTYKWGSVVGPSSMPRVFLKYRGLMVLAGKSGAVIDMGRSC